MSFFFKSKEQNPEELFSGYDPNNQLRPSIGKGDFFKLTDFDFAWLLLEPLNIAESRAKEPELAKRFSLGQKALYFWWYLDGQVTNGGFVQFYYNGYDIYVPAIIAGLEHIGDSSMANLVRKADTIFQENKDLMLSARKKNLFGSDLYERLENLSALDNQYYDMNNSTMSIIEKYARQHPNEFCVDENGDPFDENFSGICKTYYENGSIKEEFKLSNGIINGAYKTYFEAGQIKSSNSYSQGEQIGEQKEWYENGVLKKLISIDKSTKARKKEFFSENGKIKKLEHTDSSDERKGEHKEWYSNGQLKEVSEFISQTDRIGPWLKYWEDGSKQLEAEFKDSEVFFHNYWSENGEQLLKDGTGLYINKFEMDGFRKTTNYQYETEYRNYKRHGLSTSIIDGVLSSEQEFKDGIEHGFCKSYDNNGNLKEEKKFENGKLISTSTK